MVAALLPALLAAVPCAGRPASEAAVALQRAVDAAAEGGTVEVDAAQGPFDFGSSSLYLTNLTRTQVHGNGALLIFEPGHGVLVSQSRDAAIFGLSVDYDPPVNPPSRSPKPPLTTTRAAPP